MTPASAAEPQHPSYLPPQQRHLRPSYFLTPRDTARVEGSEKHRRTSQTFAKEKPSALYLAGRAEIYRGFPVEKRGVCNAVAGRTTLAQAERWMEQWLWRQRNLPGESSARPPGGGAEEE